MQIPFILIIMLVTRSGGILLVDDDPDILNIFKMILEEEGYTVYTGNNLEKASRGRGARC